MAPRGKGDEPNLETIIFRFHVKLWGCKCEHLEKFLEGPKDSEGPSVEAYGNVPEK